MNGNFYHGPQFVRETKNFSVYKMPIPSIFASALINNDHSGLTSADNDGLQSFVADLKEWLESGHIDFVDCEENTFVATFYGLQTEMINATFISFKEKE